LQHSVMVGDLPEEVQYGNSILYLANTDYVRSCGNT